MNWMAKNKNLISSEKQVLRGELALEQKHKKRVQFLRLNLFYYIYICLIYV